MESPFVTTVEQLLQIHVIVHKVSSSVCVFIFIKLFFFIVVKVMKVQIVNKSQLDFLAMAGHYIHLLIHVKRLEFLSN